MALPCKMSNAVLFCFIALAIICFLSIDAASTRGRKKYLPSKKDRLPVRHTVFEYIGNERGHDHGKQHIHEGHENAAPKNVSFIPCNQGGQKPTEPNPYDCTTYFVCTGSYYIMVSCAGELRFNRKTMECDWKWNVPCVEVPEVIQKTVLITL